MEVLVTVVILGLAGVAILAGLELTVKSSDLGRKQASGGSYVRSLAEAIQNSVAAGGYGTCANYATAAMKSAAKIPGAYSVAQNSIQTWNGSAWVACTSSNDHGTQRLDLAVTSSGTGAHVAVERLTTIVRKPCSGAVPVLANGATPC